MPRLVVATGNPGKVTEMQAYLTGQEWDLVRKPDEIDVEETGTTFMENACLKASQTAAAMGEWAIADDSGLMVDALNGAPGLYSARYASTTEARIAKLLNELGDTADRGAQFVCAVAIARPDGSIALKTEGICRGEILTAPSGEAGFGYDPVFYVPSTGKTFAEMSPDEKHAISHRGLAFQALLPQLKTLKL